MNQIDLNQPVAKLVEAQPELLPLLVAFGFKPLENPVMRQSLGRFVSLKQGCQLTGLSLDALIDELTWNGYQVTGVDSHE